MRHLVFLFAMFLMFGAAEAGAIHDAAKNGDVAGIKAALASGVDVNTPEEKGLRATALYYAASKGHHDVVELLIAAGANVNLGSELAAPPIITAAAYQRADILQLLLAHDADPNRSYKGDTALHEAAQTGCMACVKMLVEAGADVNAINAMREPAIHQALFNRHPEIADYLASHGYVEPVVPLISKALATADPKVGEQLFFTKCHRCHDGTAKASLHGGPPMWGVVGRPRASVPNYAYSEAMKEEGGVWGFEELNQFISDPSRTIPGIRMKSPGYQDFQDRANLIAFLRTLSDTPVPLPKR